MFLVVRFWDAFADLFAGRMVDRALDPVGQVPPVHPLRLAAAAADQRGHLLGARWPRRQREAGVRLHHLRAARPALQPGQHPLRLAGRRDDPGPHRTRQARHLPRHRLQPDDPHAGFRRGSADQGLQRPAALPDGHHVGLRRRRLPALPVHLSSPPGSRCSATSPSSASGRASARSGTTARCHAAALSEPDVPHRHDQR